MPLSIVCNINWSVLDRNGDAAYRTGVAGLCHDLCKYDLLQGAVVLCEDAEWALSQGDVSESNAEGIVPIQFL